MCELNYYFFLLSRVRSESSKVDEKRETDLHTLLFSITNKSSTREDTLLSPREIIPDEISGVTDIV